MRFSDYQTEGFYDEMFDEQLRPRPGTEAVVERFNQLPLEELHRRQQSAEKALLQMGITFSVYGDEQGTERIFPFDIVPRIIPQNEWAQIEAGLKQRVQAINLFIDDLRPFQGVAAGEVGTQPLRHGRHHVEIGRSAGVEPVPDLSDPHADLPIGYTDGT